MAAKLKAVKPSTANPSRPKILVYGSPGVGKSWTALDFPGVYYMDTEGGVDLPHYIAKLEASGGVYLGPEQGSQSLDVILGEIKALSAGGHPYRTLVIDSISKPYNVEIALEAERLGDKNGFGADKRPAIAKMRQIITWLGKLDMNVIMIAHAKDEYGLNDKGVREVIGQTFDAYDKLEYELHLCLQIIKTGASRKARVRKSRLFGFPDGSVGEWSYAAFADKFGRELLESEIHQIDFATPEQVSEIKRLSQIVRLPDDFISKALTKAGAENLEELDTEQAGKLVSYMNERIAA